MFSKIHHFTLILVGIYFITEIKADVQFYMDSFKWSGNSNEHDGDVCDGGIITGSKRKCDVVFKLCLSSMGKSYDACDYIYKKSREYSNSRSVDNFFWTISFDSKGKYEGGFKLKLVVHDDDSYNDDDLVDIFRRAIRFQPNNKINNGLLFGQYYHNTANQLKFRYWAKCKDNFYDDKCDTYCKQEEHSNYQCDKKSGKKICFDGWTGVDCKEDIKECNSNPCQNGGVCYESKINSYNCVCQPHYTGYNCESHVCKDSNPCLNNGTCYEDRKCFCERAFKGAKCQTNKCQDKRCLNGGVCNVTTGDCQCTKGFTDEVCQTDVCNATNKHGYPLIMCYEGNCVKGECVCRENYIGKLCNTPVSTTVPPQQTDTIASTSYIDMDKKQFVNQDDVVNQQPIEYNEKEKSPAKNYWYLILIGMVILALVVILLLLFLLRRRGYNKKQQIDRTERTISNPINCRIEVNPATGTAVFNNSINENAYSELPFSGGGDNTSICQYSEVRHNNDSNEAADKKLEELQKQIQDPSLYARLPDDVSSNNYGYNNSNRPYKPLPPIPNQRDKGAEAGVTGDFNGLDFNGELPPQYYDRVNHTPTSPPPAYSDVLYTNHMCNSTNRPVNFNDDDDNVNNNDDELDFSGEGKNNNNTESMA